MYKSKVDGKYMTYGCPICKQGVLVTKMTLPTNDDKNTIFRRRVCGHCHQTFATVKYGEEGIEKIIKVNRMCSDKNFKPSDFMFMEYQESEQESEGVGYDY